MELRISDKLAAFLIEKLEAENNDLREAHDAVVERFKENDKTWAAATKIFSDENEELKKQLQEVEKENKELNAQLAILQARVDVEGKGKPGRPKKEAQ